jgi:nitrite reductase/ring-hydroxylating ferredoxin subunit
LEALCHLDDIDPQSGKEVLLQQDDKRLFLALFRKDGEVMAYINCCPHQGRTLSYAPDKFLFDSGGNLVCPHHGACFDVDDGKCFSGPCEGASLTSVTIRIEDGFIFLENYE